MNTEIFIDPIERLRAKQANQAKTERLELYQAYREAIADDVLLSQQQQRELEKNIAEHNRWLAENTPRLEAILPRVLPALTVYEQKRDAYRNQIATVLNEKTQISVSSLWGNLPSGQRDPNAFNNIVSGIKNRLGQARGLAGSLDRIFKQLDVELIALERRGFGMPPPPVPVSESY